MTTGTDLPTVDPAHVEALRTAGVATTVEALGKPLGFFQTMDETMQRRTTRDTVAGQAVTAPNGLSDNLPMHRALEVAPAGTVLVMAGSGPFGAAWGELTSTGAVARGVAAVVIDGSVRDVDAIEELGFPVWATAVRPFGATKTSDGAANTPISCAGVLVRAGDVVVADGDGVVVVPYELVEDTVRAAEERSAREDRIRAAAIDGVMPGRTMGHLGDDD